MHSDSCENRKRTYPETTLSEQSQSKDRILKGETVRMTRKHANERVLWGVGRRGSPPGPWVSLEISRLLRRYRGRCVRSQRGRGLSAQTASPKSTGGSTSTAPVGRKIPVSVCAASLKGPRSAGSFAATSLQAREASVTSGVLVTEGRGSEALEGFGTSVPASSKIRVSEGERDRDLDFRIALKRRPCSAEVEAEVPKLRAARARRRAAKSDPAARCASRTIRRRTSLGRHVHVGHAECLEHELRHGPHTYLTPLLTDECRSTVGPQGWVPQHCVLTSVSRQRTRWKGVWNVSCSGDKQGWVVLERRLNVSNMNCWKVKREDSPHRIFSHRWSHHLLRHGGATRRWRTSPCGCQRRSSWCWGEICRGFRWPPYNLNRNRISGQRKWSLPPAMRRWPATHATAASPVQLEAFCFSLSDTRLSELSAHAPPRAPTFPASVHGWRPRRFVVLERTLGVDGILPRERKGVVHKPMELGEILSAPSASLMVSVSRSEESTSGSAYPGSRWSCPRNTVAHEVGHNGTRWLEIAGTVRRRQRCQDRHAATCSAQPTTVLRRWPAIPARYPPRSSTRFLQQGHGAELKAILWPVSGLFGRSNVLRNWYKEWASLSLLHCTTKMRWSARVGGKTVWELQRGQKISRLYAQQSRFLSDPRTKQAVKPWSRGTHARRDLFLGAHRVLLKDSKFRYDRSHEWTTNLRANQLGISRAHSHAERRCMFYLSATPSLRVLKGRCSGESQDVMVILMIAVPKNVSSQGETNVLSLLLNLLSPSRISHVTLNVSWTSCAGGTGDVRFHIICRCRQIRRHPRQLELAHARGWMETHKQDKEKKTILRHWVRTWA